MQRGVPMRLRCLITKPMRPYQEAPFLAVLSLPHELAPSRSSSQMKSAYRLSGVDWLSQFPACTILIAWAAIPRKRSLRPSACPRKKGLGAKCGDMLGGSWQVLHKPPGEGQQADPAVSYLCVLASGWHVCLFSPGMRLCQSFRKSFCCASQTDDML